jgi:NADH-quinone oxidoreductase subunit M
MNQNNDFYNLLLNLMLFAPLVGIPLLLAVNGKAVRYIALVASLIPLVLSLVIYGGYLSSVANLTDQNPYLFFKETEWFNSMGLQIQFATGIDGLSIYLVLLTTLLFPLSIWFSWHSIHEREKAYYILLLMLEMGVLGVFLSLDLVLFYVFFEVGLIPMYFLIGIWGGKDRVYAAVKFFLYTLVGSVLMLISILYLGYYAAEQISGDTGRMVFVSSLKQIQQIGITDDLQTWLFLGFIFSFAIKVPMFPFHTWLPDAHVQAPTAGSVILAGVLLKMGTYGIARFCLPLFPIASVEMAPIFSFLGLVGVIYGAMAAMVQTDVKKLVAYSSVAHMGFIMMGLFAMTETALSGAILQMINHGISTGALFFIVGMIYDRRHTREIDDFQGLAKQIPIFTLFFMITTLSSVGLPGLNGFVGEFLILIGSYTSTAFPKIFTIIATSGVIIAAVYMLWMFRRVMFGELDKEENKALTDLTTSEVLILIPLVILMFWIGFHATPFLEEINRSSDIIIDRVQKMTDMAVQR